MLFIVQKGTRLFIVLLFQPRFGYIDLNGAKSRWPQHDKGPLQYIRAMYCMWVNMLNSHVQYICTTSSRTDEFGAGIIAVGDVANAHGMFS